MLMSAHSGQADIADTMRDGLVTTFLRKPFDVDQLVQKIQAAA